MAKSGVCHCIKLVDWGFVVNDGLGGNADSSEALGMRECQARGSRLLPLEEGGRILWAPPVSAVWISRDGDFPLDERGNDFVCSIREHDFMRGRIIGKIEEGRKITDVARKFDIAHSVVSRLWKSFKTTGMCSRRHGEVVLKFLAASGKQISRNTVARRLRGGGLYARRPVVCVPLTRQHRTARLQWCREHHNWTEQDWACVLFSDESRFGLSSDCRRQLIWRESGTAYRPENIQEKDRYPTCSIMVWAGIMINGRTRLHVVANGTMTGQRYIDEVLLPHVRLFRGAVGDKFVFMDDNATCHRTLAVQDCLDSEGIQRLVWSARSPDLNPIENVWDALGRQVAGRNYPPTNKNTLIRALTEEWDKLPQQLLDNVVQSMSLVYADKPQTLGHLEDNIRRVIADIRPQMLEKSHRKLTSRLDYIRPSRGSPMPEIIFKM
ncbi:transposable element Tcb2 transposase [Trichonephila clavipes]|nr:transposable element Tcb2 transposase [Trichonephila clavipes]